MADGLNEARALRVLEIMNDQRTLEIHINSHTSRELSGSLKPEILSLPGYIELRRIAVRYQTLKARPPPDMREPSRGDPTEANKKTLQAVVLSCSSTRWLMHKLYLRAAACVRWIQLRRQAQQQSQGSKLDQAMRQIDERLRQEFEVISDKKVFDDLRAADQRHGYWLNEDPSLASMLAWLQSNSLAE